MMDQIFACVILDWVQSSINYCIAIWQFDTTIMSYWNLDSGHLRPGLSTYSKYSTNK